GSDRERGHHRRAGEPLGRLPRPDLRRRREGGRAVRRAGADSHDPALRSVREEGRGARLMQSGDFRVTYASDERIFETRLPIVALVGLLAALALVPLVAGTYWLDVLNRIGIAINGVLGFNVAPATVFGLPLDSDARIFYLIFALVVPAVFFAKNLFRTRVGRAFIAVRDRDVAASVIGVSLYHYKLLAFVISSFYAGVAGGLMAHHSRIVFPDAFSLLVAIDYLAMIIIGGMGSILGSI